MKLIKTQTQSEQSTESASILRLERRIQNSVQSVDEITRANTEAISNLLRGLLSTFFSILVYFLGHNLKDIPRFPVVVDVHPQLFASVQRLLSSNATGFTIPEQGQTLQLSSSKHHILYVAPVCSGKTLLPFGTALLYPDKTVLLATPLVALTKDLTRRLAESPLSYALWKDRRIDDPFPSILIVAMEELGTQEFYMFCKTHRSKLTRMFIDEAHNILTAFEYRECMLRAHFITRTGLPITFMTATLAERSIPHLCSSMRIDPKLLMVIRAPQYTSRLHKLSVFSASGLQEMLKDISNAVIAVGDLPVSQRGIIFCTSYRICNELAKLTGSPCYYSHMHADPIENDRIRSQIQVTFLAGANPKQRWLIATSCFGQGIHYDNITFVWHAEVRGWVSTAQQIGRASRNGSTSDCRIFVHDGQDGRPLRANIQAPDHECLTEMCDTLETKGCRFTPTAGMYGQAFSCGALTNAVLCDNCSQSVNVSFHIVKIKIVF